MFSSSYNQAPSKLIILLRFFKGGIGLIKYNLYIKASFSLHKLFSKKTQMTTLYKNLPLYITFTMIYYIRQEKLRKSFSSLSYI